MSPANKSEIKYGEKVLRVFWELLLDGRPHYRIDLAKSLGIEPGAVARAVKTIETVVGKKLIRGIKNRKRFYQIKVMPNIKIPALDLEAIRCLSVTRDLCEKILPSEYVGNLNVIAASLPFLLNKKEFENRGDIQGEQIAFKAKGYIQYDDKVDILKNLLDACAKKKVCFVKYLANGKTKPKDHYYAPGRITAMNNTLYVLGYKVKGVFDQGDPMHLSIHRIKDVIFTGKKFTFNAADQEMDAFGLQHHDKKKIRIRFDKSAADYVRDRIWCTGQSIEESDDGSIILVIESVSEREVRSWVGSFCGAGEILGVE